MGYMTKQEYERELEVIRRDNISTERKMNLEKERNKYSYKPKLPSTSKMLLWTVVLLCVEIIVFCEYAFVATRDTSFLYVLAGVPTTLVPAVCSYYSKSKKENSAGGIVFETAMSELHGGSSEEAVG